jgi:chitodextrinase
MATDEMSLQVPNLYPVWKSEVEYKVGDRVLYEDILYKVLQDHTSQEAWTPVDAASLFAKVLIPDADVIPEWEQPDSTNAYMTGDKVSYKGETYVSVIDNNTWSPEAYPAGWNKI